MIAACKLLANFWKKTMRVCTVRQPCSKFHSFKYKINLRNFSRARLVFGNIQAEIVTQPHSTIAIFLTRRECMQASQCSTNAGRSFPILRPYSSLYFVTALKSIMGVKCVLFEVTHCTNTFFYTRIA